ncbi:hypothetical protein [Dyella sp.]|uniref:hypothetical protein n=1 Tax=Dyella sp. TaxID=1869338 RepID=UPI002ED01441
MISIEQPAMVLNAVTSPRIGRLQMWNSWDVSGATTARQIIDWVATVARGAEGGKLKNLVIHSHGIPGAILIGQGFNRNNVGLFSGLSGLVDKIWLVACRPAYIDPSCNTTTGTGVCVSDGNMFVSAMARAASCYVVASTETQTELNQTYPFGVITTYEGLVLSYGPAGNVTWSRRYPSQWQGE